MVRILILLVIGIIANNPLAGFAQERGLSAGQLESKLSSIKNPFKSQLPVKKKETITVKPKPIPVEKPKMPEMIELPIIEKIPPKPIEPEIKEEESMPPLPDVTISGVIWDSDRPQAIINGHIINIGDAILQIEITDIHKTEIKGLFHGKPVTIKTQRSPI